MNPIRSFVYSLGTVACLGVLPGAGIAQSQIDDVTYNLDVAPILERSCVKCHRPNSIAPMSFLTYEEVHPWAALIQYRTELRDKFGVMPPWFIERDIGIQHYANDESLSEEEIATIATWVSIGTPEGDPANRPEPLTFPDQLSWDIGEPDLIVDLPALTMEAGAPDRWGVIPPVSAGLTEDRYVAALQILEVSDFEGGIGGNFIYHHANIQSMNEDGTRQPALWGIHEVGRNAEHYDPQSSPLLKAGSQLWSNTVHMHSNAVTTTGHLRLGFKFQPKDYQPTLERRNLLFGTQEIDLRPMEAGQEINWYHTLTQNARIPNYEPHMHASGKRMCIEAIYANRTETLSCSGYDHNWVKVYNYHEDYAPLLPKGTIIRVRGIFDVTPDNQNVVDPRNWQGLGHRSVDNMALLIMPVINLNDEQFKEEMANRRERLQLAEGEAMVGCPLCGFAELPKVSNLPGFIRR